jgi:SAM-dependent methyltransferase
MHIRFLNQCRVCGNADLTRILNFHNMPLTDNFIDGGGTCFLHDIDIFACTNCLTVQTQHDVDMEDYYEDYEYTVGGSLTANRFMRILAENLHSNFLESRIGAKVLEIGSSDGMQLLAFKELGCKVLGYEPSSTLVNIARDRGIPTIQGLFGFDSINNLPKEFKNVDAIVLSYTFDHLPQPREFLAAARSILKPDIGLLVVEVHDLAKIFSRQEFCLFAHEHSVYLTESTAAMLCELEGLTIIDYNLIPQVDRRANSLIFVVAMKGSKIAERFSMTKPLVPPEFSDIKFYLRQGQLIKNAIENLDKFVENVAAAGRSIAGYGAGGRGVMTLAAMKTSAKFLYLVDKKPKRPGVVTPKSSVPVVGLNALKESPVDEIVVFSFGYMKEIIEECVVFGYQSCQFHSLLDIMSGKTAIQF